MKLCIILAFFAAVFAIASTAIAVEPYGPAKAELTIVVMDPMAGPLACDCVQGYAQRKYERLADYLHSELGKTVKVVWSESLVTALSGQAEGQAQMVIGKDSVARVEAARAKLSYEPVAQLTDKQGSVMQRGLFVVLASSKVSSLLDLEGYRIFFGPEDCSEKSAAPKAALANIEIGFKEGEVCASCSIAAKKLKDLGSDDDAAAVISSYAAPLLEGCGTIKKGDLRVVGESENVPFISVFVASSLDATVRTAITSALLAMKTPEMLSALETKDGFVKYVPSEPNKAPANSP